jgi:hypothetical protein
LLLHWSRVNPESVRGDQIEYRRHTLRHGLLVARTSRSRRHDGLRPEPLMDDASIGRRKQKGHNFAMRSGSAPWLARSGPPAARRGCHQWRSHELSLLHAIKKTEQLILHVFRSSLPVHTRTSREIRGNPYCPSAEQCTGFESRISPLLGLCSETPLLDRQPICVLEVAVVPRVRAAGAAAVALRLFPEERHRLPVRPAWAVEPAIVLIAIFLEPPPHVALGLVPPECSGSHAFTCSRPSETGTVPPDPALEGHPGPLRYPRIIYPTIFQ